MIEYVELDLDGRKLTIETGRLARQADGAVVVTMGDTKVLGTATMSDNLREGMDFFPLVCDYEERKYSVGKIPGGFVKRGGRPSERSVLVSRLIDRPIRPLFPNGMRNEVQVIAMPMSVEMENPPDMLALIAASAALSISRIPFHGPLGAVRVIRIDGNFKINPTWEEHDATDMNVIIAGTRDAITTIDVEANEVDESVILEAINFGHEYIKKIIDLQEELVRKVGQPKAEVALHSIDAELLDAVRTKAGEDILNAVQQFQKQGRKSAVSEIIANLLVDFPDRQAEVAEAVEKVSKEQVRKLILEKGIRADGRQLDEIRQITCEAGLLPRVHGSGLFTRGQTQVLTTVTLGSVEDAQIVDNVEEDSTKRYMHYYNFPPYSVGETRPLRGPGRREVGHGSLAERSLLPVIPPQDKFPYALLLTSEVLESNGSTSMASVCGSTLALMDAGVNIKAPVAGAAMGLMTDGTKFVVLSDIRDMEDFYGDMDFKVAGSEEGVTAIQLDTKIEGIPTSIMPQALAEAKKARMHILGKMMEAISEPRQEMSPFAPRVIIIEIHPDKIGEVIGPGGKVIKKIEAETGASLSIEQTGQIFITAVDKEGGDKARKMVEDITREIKVGETYLGRVTKLAAFGAFMEILPGREGLLHISQISAKRVERIEDVLSMGDELIVKVNEINPQGKIGLTRKGVSDTLDDSGAEDPSESPARHDDGNRPAREDRGDSSETPQARFRPKR